MKLDEDYILGQWWKDDQGHLLVQPVPESGKSSFVAKDALITAEQLDSLPRGDDGYMSDAVASALGLKKVSRDQRTLGQEKGEGQMVNDYYDDKAKESNETIPLLSRLFLFALGVMAAIGAVTAISSVIGG